MAVDLRRMVVLGPAGCIYPGSPQDYRSAGNRRFFRDTGTPWVRLWADWPSLVPAPDQPDVIRLAALDAQMAQARRDGLRIMLTLYRFPPWANGTQALTAEQLAATMPDRRSAAEPDGRAKSLLFRPPDDVSETSPWGRFVELIVSRYGRTSPVRPMPDATVDFLEICNEPNLQWWPQQGPSATGDAYAPGPVTVHRVVAAMFQTAQRIVARYGGEPALAGPGCADLLDSTRLRTGYDEFAEALLRALAALGFGAEARFAWTHHNYTDVTYDQGAGSTAPDAATNETRLTNRAADMRRRLVGRWAGWPAGDPANPSVLITEGGVTLANIVSKWGIADPTAGRAKQAELLRRNWERMFLGPEGPGVAVVSNYLLYTDPNYDSGLCDELEIGGATRPAFAAWGSMPALKRPAG